MNAHYTTRTATLKTVKHDSHVISTDKLFINQKKNDGSLEKVNILDLIDDATAKIYLDDRGEDVTENDLWGEAVEADNSVIKIQNKWLSGNGYCKSHNLQYVIAADNKIKDTASNFTANVQFDKIVDGTDMFSYLNSASLDCNFDNLEIGDTMFACSEITKDEYNLPKLKHGYNMYYAATLASNIYSKNLDNLISGDSMFFCTKNINYFYCNIPYCCSGHRMFIESPLFEFRGATTYLYDGRDMFKDTYLKYITSDFSSLVSGVGMFENTDLDISAIEKIAKSIPSLKGNALISTGKTDSDGNPLDEVIGLYENGVSFDYNFPIWDAVDNKIVKDVQKLQLHPDEIGVITITWRNPVAISAADALIIEREYFKLMNLKGWTVVSNLRENEDSAQLMRKINGATSVGTLVMGPKASLWTKNI